MSEPTDLKETGQEYWCLSSADYAKESIRNIDKNLQESGRALNKKVTNVIGARYHPESDVSEDFDGSEENCYQNLIGIFHWSYEIRSIDIALQC